MILPKQDEILRVHVAELRRLAALHSLVKLGLQERPGVVRGHVLRVRSVAEAGGQAQLCVGVGELQDILAARLRHAIGVCVEPEDESIRWILALVLDGVEGRLHRCHDRDARETVRISVEAGEHELLVRHAVHGKRGKDVSRRDGHLDALRELGRDLVGDFLVRRREARLLEQHDGVLVPLGIHGRRRDHMVAPAQVPLRLFLRLGDEGAGDLLQEHDVRGVVLGHEDVDEILVLLEVEVVADLRPDVLPVDVRRGDLLHEIHENGVEDGQRQGLQRQRNLLLKLRELRVLGARDRQQLVGVVAGLLKHVRLPLGPPVRHTLQSTLVAVDHRGPVVRAALRLEHRVGHPVGHASEALEADEVVPQEAVDERPAAVVLRPLLVHLLQVFLAPAHALHAQS
mmetsp:Transcript_16250/g.61913  ORF Transcript_16250/g.61913 Transcript_16250/m.61913 type:complete len:399 (+) Transcript_16250:166-1362(+)